MCHNATTRYFLLATLAAASLAAQPALEWRKVGSTALDLTLPSLATGPIERVWYTDNGNSIAVQTATGRIWLSTDFENWKAAPALAAPTKIRLSARVPGDSNIRLEAAGPRQYAIGRFVHRSEDGINWSNLTSYRGESILGAPLTDLAVNPRDPDELTVANAHGIWRSLDGGATWSGLNDTLPNHPATRILAVPNGLSPARLQLSPAAEVEWAPGERTAWRQATPTLTAAETALRDRFRAQLNASLTRLETSGAWIYAGASDGRIFISQNNGQSWALANVSPAGAARAIWIHPTDPRIALAAFSNSPNRLFRTYNGGQDWYDATGNLPPGDAFSVTADAPSNTVYLGTSSGVFSTTIDLQNLTLSPTWTRVSQALPAAPALDLKLDPGGNQLFVLLQDFGLYATMAPHRFADARIVNAADFTTRPAAPGSLLSLLGLRADRARAGATTVPVLGATDAESQFQVPFEAQGNALQLTVETNGAQRTFPLPLARVSPTIFLDRDGAPLLLDADTGLALDAANPAKSGARIQILATGLGAVTPNWPTGVPAPEDNTPRVAAPVTVLLDRESVPVTRAVLAPRYIGFYLIEIQLPQIINAGPAELFVEAGGVASNRVRLYLMP